MVIVTREDALNALHDKLGGDCDGPQIIRWARTYARKVRMNGDFFDEEAEDWLENLEKKFGSLKNRAHDEGSS